MVVVFGPNKSGNTCLVDSLEVALSLEGVLSRFGRNENIDQNLIRLGVLLNYYSDFEYKNALVQGSFG